MGHDEPGSIVRASCSGSLRLLWCHVDSKNLRVPVACTCSADVVCAATIRAGDDGQHVELRAGARERVCWSRDLEAVP